MGKVSSVNVREIALKAGVSHITVSRALRDAPNVAPATKAKIREIAEKLGYRPNPLVSAYTAQMRRSRGEAGGCTLAWLSGEPFQRQRLWLRPFQVGVARRAAELGFTLDASICTRDLSKERLGRLIEARGIRGVIVPNLHYFSAEVPEIPGVVTVSLGNSFSGRPMHTVTSDSFVNVGTLFSHLMALGYARIGFCEHVFGTTLTQGGAWGAYLLHQQRLMPAHRIPVLTGLDVGNHEEACRKKFEAWVRDTEPDCILTGFLHPRKWLAGMGVQVPEHMGLAHYRLADDTPGWSGIDPYAEAMGAATVDLLSAHIQRNEYGTPELAKHMRFTGNWVAGETTRSMRAAATDGDGSADGDVEGGEDLQIDPRSHTHSMEWFQRAFPPPICMPSGLKQSLDEGKEADEE